MISIYNTLSHAKENFSIPHDKRVNLFVCGPTVYDASHIGHARTYIVFDVIAKYLRSKDIELFYLQNITDIDDKIIHRAEELRVNPQQLAAEETDRYIEDMRTIKIASVSEYARASDFIPEIIKHIQELIHKEHAYESGGSVYFDISSFPDFGKLSRQNLSLLQKAERTTEDQNKKNEHDFVLWRGRAQDSGPLRQSFSEAREPVWESPWGWGRPGWHIEDTAIARTRFGDQYDLHGGGTELIFPHHEAEIAQAEAASGKKPYVRFWMHAGWVTAKGQKMSKSLGNFITIREILKKYSAEALRLWVLQTHYRSPIEYSEEAIQAAENALRAFQITRARFRLYEIKNQKDSIIKTNLEDTKKKIQAAMDDDFNTAQALANVYPTLSFAEDLLNNQKINGKDADEFFKFLNYLDDIFGIIPPEILVPKEIKLKVQKREHMRVEKKWAEADSMRQEIAKEGFSVEDTPQGSVILPISKNNSTL